MPAAPRNRCEGRYRPPWWRWIRSPTTSRSGRKQGVIELDTATQDRQIGDQVTLIIPANGAETRDQVDGNHS